MQDSSGVAPGHLSPVLLVVVSDLLQVSKGAVARSNMCQRIQGPDWNELV